MAKKSSSTADVLKDGGGGLSGQTAPTQPSPLLAQGATQTPSSLLAQAARQRLSTQTGKTQSNGGSESVLTGKRELDMRTYLASLNFGLRMLQRNNMLTFRVIRDANGEIMCYQAEFDAGKYVLNENDVLALKDEAK